ncbi:MAG: PaaI family thioesterase [Burkholderiales bacterium]|nr:PaaI family thioesterase [Burkholderiales bacterium]
MTVKIEGVSEEVAAAMQETFANQGALQALGAKMTRIGRGTCEIVIPKSEAVTQHHGTFHGGVFGTMADTVGGFAAYSVLMPSRDGVAVEYKINMLAPGDGDALVGRAKVIKAGRSLAITTGEIFSSKNGEEKLCAIFQQTLFVIDKK